ncbi:MAG: hypothetical protein ACFFAO_17100 [Candidatus Hermodarchaeota archaeon]
MKIPEICPGREDKAFTALNIIRMVSANIILFLFSWILMIVFLSFELFFTFIFTKLFLCKKCVYSLGEQYNSIKEYVKNSGDEFLKRQKIIFPILLFEWYFPTIIGIIFICIYILMNIILAIVMIALLIFQILFTFITIRRTPNKHCLECIYREYCIVSNK